MTKEILIGDKKVNTIKIGKNNDLVFIGGPCAIENKDHTFYMAEKIQKICEKLKIKLIFKSCYDKDCRSSPSSFHEVGKYEGLKILNDVREKFQIPVTSDFLTLLG